jgi:D-alanine-D-alanine ligase-like ATP-grasp enzyme
LELPKQASGLHSRKTILLAIHNKVMPTIEDNGTRVELAQGGLVINGSFVKIDCVFSILHGEFGEDGKIQQLLEECAHSLCR